MIRLPSLGPRGEGWVLIQLLLLGAIAFAGFVAGGAWGGALATVSAAVGVGLIIAGAALLLRGLVDLGSSLTPMPRPRWCVIRSPAGSRSGPSAGRC